MQVTLVRRDTSIKEPWPLAKCTEDSFRGLLRSVQEGLYAQAERFLNDHTSVAKSYGELKERIDGEGGFVWAPWDGKLSSAERVQNDVKASIRLLSPDVSKAKGYKDLVSGAPAESMVLFAKAY
jgi:prolyl-tRNA synthetase